MVAELWANQFLKIGFSAISRLRELGLRRSILHSIPLVKTLLLRYHAKKGKVDPRCRPTMLALNASTTHWGQFFPFFDLYTIRRVLTRGFECNIDLLNPSSQTRAMAKSLPNAIAQRFVNACRRWLVGLFLNRFQWSIAHFTQLDELFHMRYNNKIFDP